MEKRFSIIIPAYNAEKEIERAVNSVKNQTLKNYEIIVVDDCSKDNTFEVVNKLNGVILKQTPHNAKEGGARNIGMKIAKGEYIIFLDADDYLASDTTLEDISNVIGSENPDIVYLGFRALEKENEKELIPTEKHSSFKERIRNWKYENVWDICWNTNFLRENNMVFEENRLHPDFPFYFEGIIRAKNYKVASFVTHIYTILTNKSVTSSKITSDRLKDLYFNIGKCLDMLKWVDDEKKEDLIHAIHKVNSYAGDILLQFEKEVGK